MTNFARNYLLVGSLCFLSCFERIAAQTPVADSVIRASAIASTIETYHRFITAPPALYNGPEYLEYFRSIQEGHPFFNVVEFGKGSIMYENILYKDVHLKFDLVKNLVIVKDPTEIFGISLFHDKISYFNVHGHHFVRVIKDENPRSLPTGFYDVLYNGATVSLLKKEYKSLQSKVSQLEGVWNYIDHSQDFFVQRGNEYYQVDTKGGLLKALKDKRSELQQYIRSNKLKFRKDEVENTLLKVVTYYNTLKNQSAAR